MMSVNLPAFYHLTPIKLYQCYQGRKSDCQTGIEKFPIFLKIIILKEKIYITVVVTFYSEYIVFSISD